MAKPTPKAESVKRIKDRERAGLAKPIVRSRQLSSLCERYGIRKLWVYGSILRPDFRPDSDVDVLVETDRRHPLGLFKLGGCPRDLMALVGWPVHLTTLGSVPKYLRSEVL